MLSALLNDQPFVWLVSAALVISLNLTFTRDTLKLPDCDDRGNSLSLITEGFFLRIFMRIGFLVFLSLVLLFGFVLYTNTSTFMDTSKQ